MKLIGAREKLETIRKFNNDKIRTDMVRKFDGSSKLMYLFSNLQYKPDDTLYKQELKKLDADKIATAVETTLTKTQRYQLELPAQNGGIGIGGMSEIISSMVLSNFLKIKDNIALFIEDEQILTDGIMYLQQSVKLAFVNYRNILFQYGTCNCHQGTCKERLLKHMEFEQFLSYRIGLNRNKYIDYKYLVHMINKLKLQYVYEHSSPTSYHIKSN